MHVYILISLLNFVKSIIVSNSSRKFSAIYGFCSPILLFTFYRRSLVHSIGSLTILSSQEFTNAVIQDEELSADQKDAFKEFVKERVREAKKANKEAREARRKAIEEMSEETKAAFENIRFYKFYPVQSPDAPDVSKKCEVINRYYGKAHEYL
ncbi:uncharacterized protein DS421_7g222100 [Arachis hypogaea]|nr:uncharacterized protein DS421_7g222100 [Arachis hypogaea]